MGVEIRRTESEKGRKWPKRITLGQATSLFVPNQIHTSTSAASFLDFSVRIVFYESHNALHYFSMTCKDLNKIYFYSLSLSLSLVVVVVV